MSPWHLRPEAVLCSWVANHCMQVVKPQYWTDVFVPLQFRLVQVDQQRRLKGRTVGGNMTRKVIFAQSIKGQLHIHWRAEESTHTNLQMQHFATSRLQNNVAPCHQVMEEVSPALLKLTHRRFSVCAREDLVDRLRIRSKSPSFIPTASPPGVRKIKPLW